MNDEYDEIDGLGAMNRIPSKHFACMLRWSRT